MKLPHHYLLPIKGQYTYSSCSTITPNALVVVGSVDGLVDTIEALVLMVTALDATDDKLGIRITLYNTSHYTTYLM